jgi:hypothetical protein
MWIFFSTLSAAVTTSSDPKMVIISVREAKSFEELKKGYRPERKDKRITPQDHTSIAVVW